jgi:flagellin
MVDADLAKESARLQALQTKQQLGVQALSIANSVDLHAAGTVPLKL